MKFQFLYPWIKLAGPQPHSFVLLLVMTAFMVQRQSSVAMTDTTWLSTPKIFTIWPFTEKNVSILVYTINFSRHWLLTRIATSSCFRALFGWQSTFIWLLLPGSWLALDRASTLMGLTLPHRDTHPQSQDPQRRHQARETHQSWFSQRQHSRLFENVSLVS